jgi:phosphomannomutase/phosphoglucomutase
MNKLFGTNGIRGIANDTLDPIFSLNIAMAYGTLKRGKIVIGRDTRISGEMIENSFISGLLSCGCEVIDVGIAPTPAIQYYVKDNSSVSGGVIITASHNPPEYNGIKIIAEDGTEASRDEEEKIEESYFKENFKKVNWRDTGGYLKTNVSSQYIDSVKHFLGKNLEKIRKRKFRIALDAASGSAFFTTPRFLKSLNIGYVGLNCQPDGTFPGRNPEPTEENLKILQRIIESGDFDLGIAHDGDADRSVFFDEKGRFVEGDVILAIVARDILRERKRKGEKVVTTIATSSSLRDVVEEEDGTLIETPVGSVHVARTMMKEGIFGGEGNGGLIFAEHQYCRDGLAALGKIMEIISKEDRSLSELADEVPRYFVIKEKIMVEKKEEVIKRVKRHLNETKEPFDDRDGVKVSYDDKSWLLIRASGTEPMIRIYAEAKDEGEAKKLLNRGKSILKRE